MARRSRCHCTPSPLPHQVKAIAPISLSIDLSTLSQPTYRGRNSALVVQCLSMTMIRLDRKRAPPRSSTPRTMSYLYSCGDQAFSCRLLALQVTPDPRTQIWRPNPRVLSPCFTNQRLSATHMHHRESLNLKARLPGPRTYDLWHPKARFNYGQPFDLAVPKPTSYYFAVNVEEALPGLACWP